MERDEERETTDRYNHIDKYRWIERERGWDRDRRE